MVKAKHERAGFLDRFLERAERMAGVGRGILFGPAEHGMPGIDNDQRWPMPFGLALAVPTADRAEKRLGVAVAGEVRSIRHNLDRSAHETRVPLAGEVCGCDC